MSGDGQQWIETKLNKLVPVDEGTVMDMFILDFRCTIRPSQFDTDIQSATADGSLKQRVSRK